MIMFFFSFVAFVKELYAYISLLMIFVHATNLRPHSVIVLYSLLFCSWKWKMETDTERLSSKLFPKTVFGKSFLRIFRFWERLFELFSVFTKIENNMKMLCDFDLLVVIISKKMKTLSGETPNYTTLLLSFLCSLASVNSLFFLF